MTDLIAGILLIVHGVITAAIWAAPAGKEAQFIPAHSWIVGDTRAMSVAIALATGVAFVATGVGVLMDADWWPMLAVVGGALGVVLMVVWFHPWLLLGLAISVVVLVAGARALPGS